MTDKARILIICGHYYPDYGPATPIFTTMAEDLAARGHAVTVVTTFPHYSQHGQTSKGFTTLITEEYRHGVRLIRTWVYVVPKRSLFRRMISHLMLNLFSALTVMRAGRSDVIIAAGPFHWCGLPLIIKGCGRVPFVYLVQDIYPDILIRLNILHHPTAIAVIDRIEKFFYKRSFRVSVLSEGFKRNLAAKGVPAEKISIIPVCLDTDFIRPAPKDPELAETFGLENKRVVLYAGNIGFSQGMDTLIDSAQRLAHRTDIVFLIIGEGAMREPLERRAREMGLTNCIFSDFQPPDNVPRSYSLGDIGLVLLKRDIVVESVPSKTYSIMAAGIPVVATIDQHSEVGQLIHQADCGVCLEPENSAALAQAIVDLIDDPERRRRLGQNGRDYVVTHFHRQVAAEQYERIIDAAMRPSPLSVGRSHGSETIHNGRFAMTHVLKTPRASNPIRIRVAKPSDADQLARVHQACSAHQPGSFMHHLGLAFFKQYYRILLREPTSLILCSEDPFDGIVGIASGTIDAKAETQALYAGRYRLLLGSLPELLRKPWLIKEVQKRKKLMQSLDQANPVIGDRARFSFWGYLPNHSSKGMAIRLLKTFLNVMEDLGHDSVWFENDTINVNAQKINLMLGAEIVTTYPMDDGRIRAIAVHRLQPERRRQIILKKK